MAGGRSSLRSPVRPPTGNHCLGARLADQLLGLVVAVVCESRRLDLVGTLSVSAGPTLSVDDGLALDASHRDGLSLLVCS